MPALVISSLDTTTSLMHDPKMVPVAQLPIPDARPGLPAMPYSGLQPSTVPRFARSWSHPMVPYGAPRVPPLHPPFTEDMLDIRRHAHAPFMPAVLSAAVKGRESGPSQSLCGGLPHSGDFVDVQGHPDSPSVLIPDGLSASLPVQIRTLYSRMRQTKTASNSSCRVPDLGLSSSWPAVQPGLLSASLSISSLRLSSSSSSSSSPSSSTSLSLISTSPSSSASQDRYSRSRWASSPDNLPSWPDRKGAVAGWGRKFLPFEPSTSNKGEGSSGTGNPERSNSGAFDPFVSSLILQAQTSSRCVTLTSEVSASQSDQQSAGVAAAAWTSPSPDSGGRLGVTSVLTDTGLDAFSSWSLYQQRHPVSWPPLVEMPGNRPPADVLLPQPPSSPQSYADRRSSPTKELPTKLIRQGKHRDRQEVTAALDADQDMIDRLSAIKKSTSTQTQFSSFPSDPLPLPPPPYFATHDTIRRQGVASSLQHTYRPLYPPPTQQPPPPPHPFRVAISPSSSSSLTSSSSSSSSSLSLLSHPDSNSNSSPHPSPLPHHTLLSTSVPPTPVSSSPSSVTSLSSPSSLGNGNYHMPLSCPKTLPGLYIDGTPPPPQYSELTRSAEDVQDSPLNLSIASEGPPTSSFTATPMQSDSTEDVQPGSNARKTWIHQSYSGQDPAVPPVTDEAIEEHFRRSLGRCYPKATKPRPPSPSKPVAAEVCGPLAQPPPPPPLAPCSTHSTTTANMPALWCGDKKKSAAGRADTNTVSTSPMSAEPEGVHITGSVDDHFARALGDQTWTALKAKSEPPAPSDIFQGSVDDHFAKALGASMWKRLQAEATDPVVVSGNHHHSNNNLVPGNNNLVPGNNNPHHHHHHHHHRSPPPPSASPIPTKVAM